MRVRAYDSKPANPVIPGVTKIGGQSAPMFANNGEINASSRKDLMNQIKSLISAAESNQITMSANTNEQRISESNERRQMLIEAIHSEDMKPLKILGEALAAEIIETTNREGLVRRIMQFNEIGAGEDNLVRIREKNVTAFIATSPSEVTPSVIRDRRVRPPEFEISAHPLVDLKELATTTSDLLEEKYEEALEAIMVQEDRLWKKLADEAAVVRNTIQYFSSFTPQVFSRIRTQIARWGIPTPICIIAADIWDDIIGNSDFSSAMDPVTKYELLQEGYIGQIYGMSMITDAFRQPNLRVIEPGDVYVVGAPINHGVFTVRGTMLVEPVNKFNSAKSQKGWFLNELVSMVLGNAASVAKGKKI